MEPVVLAHHEIEVIPSDEPSQLFVHPLNVVLRRLGHERRDFFDMESQGVAIRFEYQVLAVWTFSIQYDVLTACTSEAGNLRAGHRIEPQFFQPFLIAHFENSSIVRAASISQSYVRIRTSNCSSF